MRGQSLHLGVITGGLGFVDELPATIQAVGEFLGFRRSFVEWAGKLLGQASETAGRLRMIRLQRLIVDAREEFETEDDEAFPFDLNQREVEVLRLVVEGMTDGEIAEDLHVSPRTISTYLSWIYNKLGVNSRAAAAAMTVRSGLA